MKYLTLAVLVAFSAASSQAQTKAVPANPKIYVDPATGFDAYLSEAAAHNHVAITLTTEKNSADFEFDAFSDGHTLPGSGWSTLWSMGVGPAWIRLVDLRTSGLVFTCHVNRRSGADRGPNAVAESCVKHLRAVEKGSADPFGGQLKAFVLGASQWNY
jgi:hypothetical protein